MKCIAWCSAAIGFFSDIGAYRFNSRSDPFFHNLPGLESDGLAAWRIIDLMFPSRLFIVNIMTLIRSRPSEHVKIVTLFPDFYDLASDTVQNPGVATTVELNRP